MPQVRERIPLPSVTAPERSRGLPVVALLTPLGLALVLWLVTSSPYTLLFALFGPVMALAGRFDGARSARATHRRSVAEARESLASLVAEVAVRARERAERRAEGAQAPADLTLDSSAHGWWLGLGQLPSGIELVGDTPPELAAEFAQARDDAATLHNAPVVLDDVDAFHISGAAPMVRALARGLVLQAVARCAPGRARVAAPDGEEWLTSLPLAARTRTDGVSEWAVDHDGEPVLRITGETASGRSARLLLGDAGEPPVIAGVCASWRPAFVATPEAEHIARRLACAADAANAGADSAIPREVPLAELLDGATATSSGTGALLGMSAEGVVQLDLDQRGPHALIAGTTGSGKSELLVTWVTALAAVRPPSELSFLLIDFKGGSAFAPLARLPHVVGVVSDLDEVGAERAVLSLRAELTRRETLLAGHAVRDIRELPAGVLPRLMVVVDEYAALVAASPALASVFADLAARGRSLGLHLVLGTQRPAGVVRDAVLANVTVRICLRVLDAAESTGVVGVPDAAAIPAESRGRAVLHDGVSRRLVQLARADEQLIAGIAARWRNTPAPAARPWIDPLPAMLPVTELPRGDGMVIGCVDLPEVQRQDPLVVDPWELGALLVVGASGSGRTNALAAIAWAHTGECRWVGADPVALWDALATSASDGGRVLVLVDDLDIALSRVDAEQRGDLTELLANTIRESRRTGVALVASTRVVGGVHGVAAAFEQRMLLRMASREDHLLAGGEPGGFRAERRPGSALWRGHEAQLACVPRQPRDWEPPRVEVDLADGAWALVAAQPERWIERLHEAGVRAMRLDEVHQTEDNTVIVADPDTWLAQHLMLSRVRRGGRMLVHGCTRAEHRTVSRARGAVPPLGIDDAWLVDGGITTRVRIVLPA